jgi:hypothetical protein
MYKNNRTKENERNKEDVYDGSIHNEFEKRTSNQIIKMSLKHNTDGIAVFSSSEKDIWPIYLQIIELPPAMR